MTKIVNKKETKKSRKKVIAFLLMLSLVVTSGTFAYWASYVEGTSTEATGTLTVGSGDTIRTTFTVGNDTNSGGLLVPKVQVLNSGEAAVGAIDLAFDIQWLENEKTTQMLGVDSVGQIKISDEVVITLDGKVLDAKEFANIYALVNVQYSKHNVTKMKLDAPASTFTFEVTLDEPADQAEYNMISKAVVSITFSYTIDTNDIVSTDLK